jgi:thymidine kinase
MADSYLELCIGPMFAGKTTYLLEVIQNLIANNYSFIVIKPVLDNRSHTNMITSHNNVSYNCIDLERIDQLNLSCINDYIVIEEGQFFPDLYDSVLKLLHMGKKIYIAGLNGDYQMNPLGSIINLIPLADNIIYKHAICSCSKPASFSCRKITDNKSQILIGGSDVYIPTCKQCYFENQNENPYYNRQMDIV